MEANTLTLAALYPHLAAALIDWWADIWWERHAYGADTPFDPLQ